MEPSLSYKIMKELCKIPGGLDSFDECQEVIERFVGLTKEEAQDIQWATANLKGATWSFSAGDVVHKLLKIIWRLSGTTP
jgi:hypothetical protein